MATYDTMRISVNGGGVANANEKAPRDNSAHIFIGLGGTGVSALQIMKRMVYERLEPDDPHAEVPSYDRLAFLAVDSDKTNFPTRKAYHDLDPLTEFCDIGMADIKVVLANPDWLDQQENLKWFNHRHMTLDNATAGAGGVRQMGRYLLTKSVNAADNNFYTKVRDAIKEAITIDNDPNRQANPEIYIHLFSGISGGTGSGTFLDACYLIRRVCSELQITGRANLYGYFYLPDINLSAPGIKSNTLNENYITDNGFAAMMELDYLMSGNNSGDSFSHNYGKYAVGASGGIKLPPVDRCHLLSGTDMKGNPKKSGVQFATNSAAEYILNFMIAPTADMDGSNSLTLAGSINNLSSQLGGMASSRRHGGNYAYTVLGSASAIIPYKTFSTYLASYLFQYFETLRSNEPLPKDVDAVVNALRLTLRDMASELRKGSSMLSINGKSYNTTALRNAISARDPLVAHKPLIDYMEQWEIDRQGMMKKNLVSLEAEIASYAADFDRPVAYLAKIFKHLQGMMDADRGPYYICELIESKGVKHLVAVIKGMKDENESTLTRANGQRQFRIDQLREAAIAFQQKNPVVPAETRKKRYLSEWEAYYENEDRIYTAGLLASLLEIIENGLISLRSDYYARFRNVWETLCQTFEDNRAAFDQNKVSLPENVIELVSWRDPSIRQSLDDGVTQKLEMEAGAGRKTAKREINKFLSQLVSNFPLWKSEKESAVGDQTADYINASFTDILNQTMDQLLRKKYGVNVSLTGLGDMIFEQIIKGVLKTSSCALFHVNPLFVNETPSLPTGYTLSVPVSSGPVSQAAITYQSAEGNGVVVRKSGIKDRISMFTYHSGIPIWAYQPVSEYHNTYVNNPSRVGKHLYEGQEKDWRKLSILFPHSFIDTNFVWTEQERKRNQELAQLFRRGQDIGCLVVNGQSSKALYTDADALAAFLQQPADANVARDTIAKWGEKKTKLFEGASALAFQTGTTVDIALDDFIRFPRVHEIVRMEVAKYDEVEQHIVRLTWIIQEGDDDEQWKIKFFNALFTGYVRVARGRLEMLDPYAPQAEENVTKLTDPAADFNTVLLYQAFMAFKAQSSDIKDELSTLVNTAIADVTDEQYEKVVADKPRYDALIAAGKAAASSLPNAQMLRKFYDGFEAKLKEYIVLNK